MIATNTSNNAIIHAESTNQYNISNNRGIAALLRDGA
jgi:hypothetical protein